MPANTKTDNYSNMFTKNYTQSVANALEFTELDFGLNIFDKVALLISRIEYQGMQYHVSDNDETVLYGLCTSNEITAPAISDQRVVDLQNNYIKEVGTAASGLKIDEPIVKDYSTLKGGGILITPKPLYLFVKTTNVAEVVNVQMRMYFTLVSLKPEEYWELLESRRAFA